MLLAGQAAYARGAYADAAGLIGAATPALRAAYGPAHPHLVQAAMTQGFLDGIRGDTDSLIRHSRLLRRRPARWPDRRRSPQLAPTCSSARSSWRVGGPAARVPPQSMRSSWRARRSTPRTRSPPPATTQSPMRARAGRWSVARVYNDLALALRQSLFGAEHPLTATSWEQLGHIAADSRDYPAARDAFELAVRIRQVALGGTHPLSATAQFALAQTYVALGDLTRAQAEAVAALSRLERTHGTLHPHSGLRAHCSANSARRCAALVDRARTIAPCPCAAGEYEAHSTRTSTDLRQPHAPNDGRAGTLNPAARAAVYSLR
ncbi:MAG: tetratricopeptide repeat protein [Kouleothrix sp.]